jgi:hypothetical protein
MITVTIMTSDRKPLRGLPFQLVSANGAVVASAQSDANGMAKFEVGVTGARDIAIRLDLDALEALGDNPR